MAISKIEETSEALSIAINNGDLKALAEIQENWKFKDKESALRFAIAVLKQSNKDSLGLKNKEGNLSFFQPSDELLAK